MEQVPNSLLSGDEVYDEFLLSIRQPERDSLMYDVIQGLQGKNAGIKCSDLPEFNRVLKGIQKARYYLIGAESGAGKTTFGDFAFVLDLYFECKRREKKLIIPYWSYEISKIPKRAKVAAYLINKRHNYRISSGKILREDEDEKMTLEELKLVHSVEAEVEQFFKDIIFIDEPTNPTGMYKFWFALMEEHGTFQYEEYQIDGKPRHKIVGYTSNDPDLIILTVIDHIALAHLERGYDLKTNIDKISEYLVYFRNRCGMSALVIQQFNTELSSTYRKQQTEHSISPQRLDFGDSKYTYRDADVVLGLVDPALYDVSKISVYETGRMNDKLRALFIIKNRYGSANIRIPMLIDPYAGIFYELKKQVTPEYLNTMYTIAQSL